jgi:hypothetical protein
MGSRIFWFCILLVVCVGAYFMYDHYHQEKLMGNGDVACTGCMTPEESARFAKEDSGDTADGQSERKIRTAREEDAAGNPQGAVAAGQVAATPAAAPAAAAASAATPAPGAANQPSKAPGAYTVSSGAPPANLPTTDSVPPNPANGARFSGSGAYQWYRQGNLTWRVDTVSGRSCIDYATMEEWHKPIVSSHGCGA